MTTHRPSLKWVIPLRLAGGLNAREHWGARSARVAKERRDTRFSSMASLGRDWFMRVQFPVEVTITRVGPRFLDLDNLYGSCKGVRDEVADMLGITDGPEDSRATWRCQQRKGTYGVEVEIRALGQAETP